MLETQASVIARYWYCAEQGKMLFEGIKGETSASKTRGNRVDKWLKERPKSVSEITLLEKLEDLRPFFGDYEGVRIFVRPDDFEVQKKRVRIEEFKTVHSWGSLK